MIGLLAWRMLTDRPRRSLLLLLGFGISVGVMIVLLSIGEAVLDQARDKDLVGGGDLVVLPEGVDVEVLKVGGATGMFFAIDNARFVYRQILSGPRLAGRVVTVPAPAWPGEPPSPPLAAASPALVGKVVYVRKKGRGGAAPGAAPRRVLATGVIPSLDRAVRGAPRGRDGQPLAWPDAEADRMWMEPPVDSLYAGLDRFHVPPAGRSDLDRWAEWLYFDATDPATGARVLWSTIVTGDPGSGKARALPLLQIVRRGEPPARFGADIPLAPADVATDRLDLRFAATRVVFHAGAWRIDLGWNGTGGRVRAQLAVRPVPDLYYPPFLLHTSESFLSGYAVPAIGARTTGWIEAGGRRLELLDAPTYHDHNWGTWRDVHWDWGMAGNLEQALFFGRVEHPGERPGPSGAGLFLVLSQARRGDARGGLLGLFRPDSIATTWDAAPPPLPGSPARVPRALALAASPGGDPRDDRIEAHMTVLDVLSTPPRPPAEPLVFLQSRGSWRVTAQLAGRALEFTAPGAAETFVPSGERHPRRAASR